MSNIRTLGGRMARRAARYAVAAAVICTTLTLPTALAAQWVTTYEQFYQQASHNWVFRNNYQAADRLFNAFDYGHAILYEKLWTMPDASPAELDVKEYDFLTKRVLVRPPRVPLEEGAIEIKYVQLAPEAKQMFEWAHILHRQLYDVLADERLDQAGKDREVQRLIDYYKSRRDVAFSSKPKSMKLMQEQPYSLAFRRQYPKFNGLIWGYHWLQVGLYEPLMVGKTVEERQAGVRATTARFWQMLQDPPRTFPYQMPMTPAVAPVFSARYQEAAIIFDNLHSMHDVISDILANDSVPRDHKRAEILLAAGRFRDDTSYVMTPQAWLTMVGHMGIENMGGPSVGFLPTLQTPTVTYGAVMSHDDRTGAMVGFKSGQATGGEHAGHTGATPTPTQATTPGAASMAGMNHAGMNHAASESSRARIDSAARRDTSAAHDAMKHGVAPGASENAAAQAMMREMHDAMLRDPAIRARVIADPALRAHQQHLESMGAVDSLPKTAPARRSSPAKPAAKRAPAKATPKAAPKPADPHAGHVMPAATPPVKKPPTESVR
ncbi:hypothetical protein [Gemmatimonas sp.]|uniref:hypothetical protein n=1 Tax=Gemmatimonas sp. TaxID=1962908 RepID=UPI00286D8E25|nr:hypothetical protein [Gemmatimonas sp.]